MLEAKDLEMITEIVTRVVEKNTAVMREDIKELRQDVTALQQDVTELRQDVTALQQDVSELRQDVTVLQQDVTELQKGSETMEKKISAIKMTQENEVLKGIYIIGEGHLDLNRKLNQILETREDRELMKLRIQYLEGEVRRIKDRLEIA